MQIIGSLSRKIVEIGACLVLLIDVLLFRLS